MDQDGRVEGDASRLPRRNHEMAAPREAAGKTAEIDLPSIFWGPGVVWKLTLAVDGKTLEFPISRRNAGILLRSIGAAFEQEYRPQELTDHFDRCAV